MPMQNLGHFQSLIEGYGMEITVKKLKLQKIFRPKNLLRQNRTKNLSSLPHFVGTICRLKRCRETEKGRAEEL